MCTCTRRSALEPLCTARGQRPGRILSINGLQASRKWIRRRGSKAWPACEKERVDRGDVGEEKDQGRGCCERAGLEAEIETRSTHQGSECAAAAANCSRAAKQVQLLEGEENICLVDSHGKDEKNFTAELSQAIEPASSRTAAGRPALRAKSGAASDQAARSCPPVVP